MSSLRNSSDQFRNALAEMPMPSRILSFVLVGAVVAGLGLLIRNSQAVQTTSLFFDRTLADQEIDAIELSFSRAGLSGWQRGDKQIKVPTERRSEFLAALDANTALPTSLRSSLQAAIDKASLFEPTSQREARQSHAKEQDLGNKLSAFSDISWASVEHDLGERKGLSAARTQSASVVVCPSGERPLTPARIQMIREYIRGSYAGMRAEDVVVIDTNADVAACAINDPVARSRCEEEARLKQEIHDILRNYGPIQVSAYVEMASETASLPAESTPAIVRGTATKRVSADPPGKHSLLGEIIEAVTQVSSNRATSLPQPTEAAVRGTPIVSVNKLCLSQPTVHQVRLSIGIPETYYERVWEQLCLRSNPEQPAAQIPPLQTSDLEQLQKHATANITTAVMPALLTRLRPENQAAATVDVWSYPAVGEGDPATDDAAGDRASFMTSWQTLLLVVLGVAVISILLHSLRATRSSNPSNLPEDATLSGPSEGVSDELASLVRQHPDLAVDAIRDWIAEAA